MKNTPILRKNNCTRTKVFTRAEALLINEYENEKKVSNPFCAESFSFCLEKVQVDFPESMGFALNAPDEDENDDDDDDFDEDEDDEDEDDEDEDGDDDDDFDDDDEDDDR